MSALPEDDRPEEDRPEDDRPEDDRPEEVRPQEVLPEADSPEDDRAGDELPRASPEPAVSTAALRLAEALLFASDRPVTPARLQPLLAEGEDAAAVLRELGHALEGRGVVLVETGGGYVLRTAPDLAAALTRVVEVPRRLPRAAMEALAVIAWHQPCTRAEIEEIRGASLAQATLEALLDHGLVAPRGHKEVPGRPTLWGTTARFLEQFGLKSLRDLPRREELVSAEAAAPVMSAPPISAPPISAMPPPGDGQPG